jgi:uncharacterized protein (UPF0548 family)
MPEAVVESTRRESSVDRRGRQCSVFRATSVSTRVLEQMLDRARQEQPTYDEVGATEAGRRPTGYRHDGYQVRIGGPDDFSRAREGLTHWRAHLGAGARVFPSDPVTEGATVLVLLGAGPLQMVAPCRIVSVIDEEGRFGFAYGTLPGHPERGEELFVVEQEDDRCLFRITAFSRPDQLLVRLGGPVARRIQRSVTHRYLESLARYVAGDGATEGRGAEGGAT